MCSNASLITITACTIWEDMSLVWYDCWEWLHAFVGCTVACKSWYWAGHSTMLQPGVGTCEQFSRFCFWYMSFRKSRDCWLGGFTYLENMGCTKWCHLKLRLSYFNKDWEDNTRCMAAMTRGSYTDLTIGSVTRAAYSAR